MWPAIGVIAALLVIAYWVTKVNARHEERAENPDASSADEIVTDAWDDFGLADEPEQMRAALADLLERAPVADIERTRTLVRLALMAIRSDEPATLRAAARRARKIDPECAESIALRALAAAHRRENDDDDSQESAEAAEKLFRQLTNASRCMAGCSACSTDLEMKLLLQEVAIALDAHFGDRLREEEAQRVAEAGRAARTDDDRADEASPDASHEATIATTEVDSATTEAPDREAAHHAPEQEPSPAREDGSRLPPA